MSYVLMSRCFMKGLFTSLLLLLFLTVSGADASTTFAWLPPLLNVDGTPCDDIAGYKIYYDTDEPGAPYNGAGLAEGKSPITILLSSLTDPDHPEFTFSEFQKGSTYHMSVTAFDLSGNESSYSKNISINASELPPDETTNNSSTSFSFVESSVNQGGSIIHNIDFLSEQGSGDAEEQASGNVWLNSHDLKFIDNGTNQTVGLRFNTIPIPQGAIITKAYIQFQGEASSSGAAYLMILGEDADHAKPFENADWNISSRILTDSVVMWVPKPWIPVNDAGSSQMTPDISTIIQEIVNRPGWHHDNALAIIITGRGIRMTESYAGGLSGAPRLYIEYSLGQREVLCHDRIDNDNDGLIDCQDPECEGSMNGLCNTGLDGICTEGDIVCGSGFEICVPDLLQDELPEVCDGVDNNCDGLVDEGCPLHDSLDIRIEAGSDDAEEESYGLVWLGSYDLDLTESRSNQTIGMRFNLVNIPQGALITNAYIQFEADAASTKTTFLTIQGEDVNHALTFMNSKWNISSRKKLESTVEWNPLPWSTIGETGLVQQTPDISLLIQEIVNRSGWTAGNSLAIIITGSGKRNAVAYEGDTSGAPLLHVEFAYHR